MPILEALVPPRGESQPLRVVGVADLNPQAPGILYAYRHNLFVAVDVVDLLELPELDIIVNATGHPEVSHQIEALQTNKLIVLNVDRPAHIEDFWDLISMDLSPAREDVPLKIGLVGGGKGGHEILWHLTKDQRYRNRIEIIGVADTNGQAPGMTLARELGIPTFTEYPALLGHDPDLVLELTGDPEVREDLLREKGPHTQIVDHIKARLFWDLLKREEDRLRSKVTQEIKLAGQRSRFQRIFDHLPDPVIVLRSNYLVEEANLPFLTRFEKGPRKSSAGPAMKCSMSSTSPATARA